MGISHAAAVWIPSDTIDREALEEVAASACEHDVDLEVFTRAKPATTCLVVSLDLRADLQLRFDLLHPTASAIARTFKLPTWSLYAQFGATNWLQITRFTRTGRENWKQTGADQKVAAPYRKMMREAAPRFREDVLAIGSRPAFDLEFLDGWAANGSFRGGDEETRMDRPPRGSLAELAMHLGIELPDRTVRIEASEEPTTAKERPSAKRKAKTKKKR